MSKLKGELYTIEHSEISTECAVFDLKLNSGCKIYEGHFPGNPITPGVCLLQAAIELCEEATGVRCQLLGCKNIKYIQIISPNDYPDIRYKMDFSSDGENMNVKLSISFGEVIFSKMTLAVKKI